MSANDRTPMLEEIEGYYCEECDEFSDGCLDEPLYECVNCGVTFARSNSYDGGSNRCPDCNKFSQKRGDKTCFKCESSPVEPATGFKCGSCDDTFREHSDAEMHWLEEHDENKDEPGHELEPFICLN